MAKHLAKLSKFGGQYRVTIPRKVIDGLGWQDVEFIVLEDLRSGAIYIRRFIDGESLKASDEVDPGGSD